MSKRKNDGKTYTDEGGKFAPGNPGRPKGARYKITRAVEELLDGEGEAITRKAVQMALDGDTTALRLCLERIAPRRKDTPVQFDLPPIQGAEDASQAAQAVLAAVSAGGLTPLVGDSVRALFECFGGRAHCRMGRIAATCALRTKSSHLRLQLRQELRATASPKKSLSQYLFGLPG